MAAKKNKSQEVKIDKDALIDIFTRMVRARKADETLMEVFTAGEVPGFLHVAIGQEATPAVVSHLLNDDDCYPYSRVAAAVQERRVNK